jgi:hypothetical protein
MSGRQDIASGVVLTALSAGACVVASQLGLGSLGNPGAGSIPFGIAALLGSMSIGLVAKGLLRRDPPSEGGGSGWAWTRPLLVLVALVGYGVVLRWLGFVTSTFLVMMALTWGVGRQRVLLSLLVSVVAAAAAYGLFVAVLGLPFPAGSAWSFMER